MEFAPIYNGGKIIPWMISVVIYPVMVRGSSQRRSVALATNGRDITPRDP